MNFSKQSSVEIDPVDEDLRWAEQVGDNIKIRRLIESGASINSFDEIGNTALHYAAEKGNLKAVELLLELGANVNARDEKTNSHTVLGKVAANCSLEMARLLLAAGADPTIRGWMKLNAIDRAAGRKRGDGPQVYELLCTAARRRHSDTR